MTTMVRFRTGNATYYVPVANTLEVRSINAVVPLPIPTPGVTGILERDGQTFPVVNALGPGTKHVLLIAAYRSPVGVIVEEVMGIVDIPEDSMGDPPPGQDDALVKAVICEDEGLSFVVDVGELVRWAHSKEMQTVSEGPSEDGEEVANA